MLFTFLGLYAYGFPLMIWALYFDKHPSRLSLRASKYGLIVLAASLIYFFSILWFFGIT